MTINLDVQDIENYPGIIKRVTLDTETVVPTGVEGDEKYMLSASTTAYSDNTERTVIQDLYIAGGKIGWVKSSGFKGVNGKFALDATNHVLAIKMDNASVDSGSGAGYYTVDLDHLSGAEIKGEDIAIDLQLKLRAKIMEDADAGFELAYKNCSVKFTDNKFHISSGIISSYLTGPSRSSVVVGTAAANDCSSLLGFDYQVNTVDLDLVTIIESPLLADYNLTDPTVTITLTTGVNTGDAIRIMDTNNSDNFIVSLATANVLTVDTSAITHNYTTTSGAYVQVLTKADPDNSPNNYYKDTDELLRYMAKIMINQIDFA